MTVQDILNLAFANEYEDIENDPEAKRFSINVLNMLLADAFEAEQNFRASICQELLVSIPTVRELTDTVPYNDKLTRLALPYGIEWKYCEQNLEMDKAAEYRALYEEARHIGGSSKWNFR